MEANENQPGLSHCEVDSFGVWRRTPFIEEFSSEKNFMYDRAVYACRARIATDLTVVPPIAQSYGVAVALPREAIEDAKDAGVYEQLLSEIQTGLMIELLDPELRERWRRGECGATASVDLQDILGAPIGLWIEAAKRVRSQEKG